MRVRHLDSVAEFAAAAFPFLEEREVEHNLLLGIAGRLVAGGTGGSLVVDEEPGFWLVEDGDRTAAAALVTPPYDLVLSLCEKGVASALAEALADEGRKLPGASGPLAVAREFARAWTARTGVAASLLREERLYELTGVTPPSGVSGAARAPTASDAELLSAWLAAFDAEAGTESDPAAHARSLVEGGLALLWLDRQPVSLAVSGRRTRHGASIGPVYTPPEHRRRGYGSAVTAALTRHLLDAGRSFCCLYADLANPSPNRIYQRIGYRPIIDVRHYRFSAWGTRG